MALSLLPYLSLLLLPSAHAFLLLAKPLLLARMDPIVQPGAVSQHTHAVIGGSSFQLNYDYDTYASSDCTTLEVTPDKSNYWSPAVFGRNSNGTVTPLEIQEVRVYYLKQGDADIQAFPNGLKMVAGNAMSLNETGNEYDGSKWARFDCQQGQSGPDDGVAMRGFPPYVCAGFLRASIPFPNCWDGQNLDSPDHYAHTAYAGNGGGGDCPSTHPVRFPQLVVEYGYISNGYAPDKLVMANGDTTGYSLHADFAMGWNRNILSSALADPTCQHRENVYDSGTQCATLRPYANPDAAKSCALAGHIPQESVGLVQSLPQLPGCNPFWSSGLKPGCRSPDSTAMGRPSEWFEWSGMNLPVYNPSGSASKPPKGHKRMRMLRKRSAHFVAGALTAGAVVAL